MDTEINTNLVNGMTVCGILASRGEILRMHDPFADVLGLRSFSGNPEDDYFSHPSLSYWERERRWVAYRMHVLAQQVRELSESQMFQGRREPGLRATAHVMDSLGDHLSLWREV